MTAVDDLHDWDNGPNYEAQQAKNGDDRVLNFHPGWKSLCVEGEELQQRRKYEC